MFVTGPLGQFVECTLPVIATNEVLRQLRDEGRSASIELKDAKDTSSLEVLEQAEASQDVVAQIETR